MEDATKVYDTEKLNPKTFGHFFQYFWSRITLWGSTCVTWVSLWCLSRFLGHCKACTEDNMMMEKLGRYVPHGIFNGSSVAPKACKSLKIPETNTKYLRLSHLPVMRPSRPTSCQWNVFAGWTLDIGRGHPGYLSIVRTVFLALQWKSGWQRSKTI